MEPTVRRRERKDEERGFARTYNSTSSETAMKQFSRSSYSIESVPLNIVMAKSAVVKIFYSEAEKQKSVEASKKQTAKKSNASPISKAARGKPGAKSPKAKVVKSAARPIKKIPIKSPKITQPKKVSLFMTQ